MSILGGTYITRIKCVRDFTKMLHRLKLLHYKGFPGLKECKQFVDRYKPRYGDEL